MRKWLMALAMVAVLGCDRPQGGGGGSAQAPTDTEVHGTNPDLSRDYMGDSLVAAARVHQALAVGRVDAARPALRELRSRLAKAALVGELAQQREVVELEAAAIELQGFIDRQSPEAVGASASLVKRLLTSFDHLAALPSAGGGGGGGTASPAPSPTAGFDELDPGQLLEQKPQ